MKKLYGKLAWSNRLGREKQEGLTIVEYAIAGALVAAALVLAFTNLGSAIGSTIQTLKNAIG